MKASSISEKLRLQPSERKSRGRLSAILLAQIALMTPMFAANASAQQIYAGDGTSENTVVVLGDSNASGIGVGRNEAFPVRLQENLRRRGWAVNVINAGVAGDTFGKMLRRVDFSVPKNAGLVVLQGGYNDLANDVPPDVTTANLDAILSRLEVRGIKTIVCGFFDSKWDAIGQKLAARHHAKFIAGSACYDPGHVGSDGLHMSAAGHDVVARRLTGIVLSNAPRYHAMYNRSPVR